jgi:hypothetical protein
MLTTLRSSRNYPKAKTVRKHLTKFLWLEDRLCCLSTKQLFLLNLTCLAMLVFVFLRAWDFFEDLAFLLAENESAVFAALVGLLLLGSVLLWLFAIMFVHLTRSVLSRRHRA